MRYPAILIVLIISAGVLAQTNVLTMEQKMRKIIIPQIEFHQADAVEALSFLIQASTEPCPTNTPCIGLLQTNTPSIPVKTFTLQLEDGTPLAFPP